MGWGSETFTVQPEKAINGGESALTIWQHYTYLYAERDRKKTIQGLKSGGVRSQKTSMCKYICVLWSLSLVAPTESSTAPLPHARVVHAQGNGSPNVFLTSMFQFFSRQV